MIAAFWWLLLTQDDPDFLRELEAGYCYLAEFLPDPDGQRAMDIQAQLSELISEQGGRLSGSLESERNDVWSEKFASVMTADDHQRINKLVHSRMLELHESLQSLRELREDRRRRVELQNMTKNLSVIIVKSQLTEFDEDRSLGGDQGRGRRGIMTSLSTWLRDLLRFGRGSR
jgi:hypothetical protein